MEKLEKAIKGLECCVFPVSKGFPYQSHIADRSCEVIGCPYRDDCDQLLLDSLELLKAQEPVEPKFIDGKRNHFILCGNCNTDLMRGMKFCSYCGREVKWK